MHSDEAPNCGNDGATKITVSPRLRREDYLPRKSSSSRRCLRACTPDFLSSNVAVTEPPRGKSSIGTKTPDKLEPCVN